MTDKKFSIKFGALANPIGEQLARQGIMISRGEEKRFDDIANAIVMLHLHGIIPDSVRDNARKKLMKQISKVVHTPKSNNRTTTEWCRTHNCDDCPDQYTCLESSK